MIRKDLSCKLLISIHAIKASPNLIGSTNDVGGLVADAYRIKEIYDGDKLKELVQRFQEKPKPDPDTVRGSPFGQFQREPHDVQHLQECSVTSLLYCERTSDVLCPFEVA